MPPEVEEAKSKVSGLVNAATTGNTGGATVNQELNEEEAEPTAPKKKIASRDDIARVNELYRSIFDAVEGFLAKEPTPPVSTPKSDDEVV